jgi:two-component system response regulator HydG
MPQLAKVLIVDDEPTILLSLSHCLQRSGVTVTTCRGLRAAEEALQADVFDLAIIDLCLSGSGRPDGLELVRAAKEANPQTHVIVITAYGTDDLRRQALEHGAAGYFSKPINLDELLSAVQNLRPPAPAG